MVAGEKLLTVRELAKLLHLHPDTIRDRITAGAIEGYNVGSDLRCIWVVTQSAFDAYMKSRSNRKPELQPAA